MAANPLQQNN